MFKAPREIFWYTSPPVFVLGCSEHMEGGDEVHAQPNNEKYVWLKYQLINCSDISLWFEYYWNAVLDFTWDNHQFTIVEDVDSDTINFTWTNPVTLYTSIILSCVEDENCPPPFERTVSHYLFKSFKLGT